MMFQSPFFAASQSPFDQDSFDTDFSSFGQNNFNIQQNSASFLVRNAPPPKQPDTSGEDRSSRSSVIVQEIGNVYDHDEDSYDQAPPATLHPPISTYSPVQYSSTPPMIEYPDSDTEDFSTSVSPYTNSYNQFDSSFQNINVNFEYNEATLNTVATVMNHDVHVDEQIIDSTALVVHHNVEVDEIVQNSVATVENHLVDVDEQTHHTTANVTHHEVEVEENLISTVANVESNFIEVKAKTLTSIANVEDHELDIRKNTIRSVANVDNHKLKVKTNTVESIANVDNHEVNIQTNNYVTTANVDNHNVLVQKHNYSSIADVECHFLDIQKKEIKSTATVENHFVDVYSNDTKTIANVDNHYIDIHTNNNKSVANVDNHYIDIHTNNNKSVANVDNHYIDIHTNNNKSVANVDNLYIDVQRNVNRSIANVDNHYVDIVRNDNRTIANVDNHYVDVYANEQRSIARVDNHFVQVQESTQNSLACVQHHCVNVNEMTLMSTANIYSNEIKVNHEIIPSTAEVQNHKVNVVEKTLESTISVPKFVVNVQEKEVPINISTENLSLQLLSSILQLAKTNAKTDLNLVPASNDRSSISTQVNLPDDSHRELVASLSHPVCSSDNALSYSHTPMETTTKPYSPRCSILDDGDSVGQSSSPSQVITESDDEDRPRSQGTSSSSQSQVGQQEPDSGRRDSSTGSSSERESQRDSDHEDNRPPARRSTTNDEGEFTPESLQRELRTVSSYDDLRRIRLKWNHKLVDASQWGSDVDVAVNPIMWNVVISSEWPGVGRFVCPECLVHADDVHANIRLHLDHEHATVPIDALHNATIAKIIGRSHLWRLSKEGSDDVVIESVYACTHEGCKYFTNVRKNYLSHLRSHAQLNDLVQKLGMFWGSIIDRAKSGNMLKASDIFRERVGYGCPLCDDYISSSMNNFQLHLSLKHSETRIEGAHRPSPIQIRLVPLIDSEIDEIPPGIEFVRITQRRGPRNPTAAYVEARTAPASSNNSQNTQSANPQSALDSQNSQSVQSAQSQSTQNSHNVQSTHSQSQSTQNSQNVQSTQSQSQSAQNSQLQSPNSQVPQLDDHRLRDIIDVLSLGSANNSSNNNSNARNNDYNFDSSNSNNNSSTGSRNNARNIVRLPDISDSDDVTATSGTNSIASDTQSDSVGIIDPDLSGSVNSPVNSPSATENAVEDFAYYNKRDLFEKCCDWYMKCDNEELDGISLPRLKSSQRKRVLEPIRILFDTEINNLIKCIKVDNIDDDDWFITEGILARISLLIRKTIRTALRIPINNTKKKKVRNRDLEYNRSTLSVKRIFGLTELCDLLEKLCELFAVRNTAANRNSIANLERRILDCIQQTDRGIVHELFNGNSLEDVRRFLSDTAEHRDSKIDWLRSQILKEEKNYEVLRGHRHEKTIREFYHEDARRCADWFIYGDVSPECKVPIEDFENHFTEEWRKRGHYDSDSPLLKLEKLIDEDSQQWLLEKLSDIESIEKVIQSKANMSAAGCDGISNVVWKSNVAITSKLVSRLIKAMLASGKTPSAWKRSKTIMLFKKGNNNDVKSWRPISLTPTLYRIVMGQITNVIQDLNKRCPFLCHAQKGFISNVNGCSEHIGVLNELIADATRNKKSINILTLDFANAFGSVDHRQIVNGLKSLGFPRPFCKLIKDLYKDNITFFSVNGERSHAVPMERGVRQGCPFSPILFNICLEPLLRKLLLHHSSDGYRIKDLSFCVQAFADDVVLISNKPEQLRSMLSSVEEFCSASGMNLTGSKCKWLSYMMINGRRVASSETLHINDDVIKPIGINDCLKYLGAPIATNRAAKMKFTQDYLLKVRHQVNQLLLSPLTFSQSLDALRRLIVPQLDFIFMNGVVSSQETKKLDECIRSLIQRKLKSPGLPIEVVHSHWKDGGMSIPRLVDRLELLQIRNFLGLLYSKDEKIRQLMKLSMADEIRSRHIEQVDVNESNSFFGLIYNTANDYTRKTNTVFFRAFSAAHKLKIAINFENMQEDEHFATSNDLILNFIDSVENDDISHINDKSFLKIMNKSLRKKYHDDLLKKEFRCHSFNTLRNSPLSNFFVGNHRSPTSDCLVKFAFQSRTNSLLTEEIEHKRDGNVSDKCKSCGGQLTGSLMHKLNKCLSSMTKITKRHNEIARVISDGLRDMWKFNCPPLNENSTVFVVDEDQLPERSRNFKPDIWFYTTDPLTQKKSFTIIEITCPYGMLSDSDNGRTSTLDQRREEKLQKYAPLIDDIKTSWNANATLHVIVVSSLGAIPKETIDSLNSLFDSKKRSNTIAKRCVITAIRGSWAIFYGKDLISRCHHDAIPDPSDADDFTSSSSSHLTDEEVGDNLDQ